MPVKINHCHFAKVGAATANFGADYNPNERGYTMTAKRGYHRPSRIATMYLGLSAPETQDTVAGRSEDTRILADQLAGDYGRSRAYWLDVITGDDR